MKIKPVFAIGFLLAAFTTVLAVGVVSVNVRGHSAWDTYAAEARQRGIKMSLKELLPPPVSDAENFAAVPLFANLFSEDEAVRTAAQKALTLPEFEDADGRNITSGRASNMGEAQLIDLRNWQIALVRSGDLSTAGADPAADVLKGISQHCGPALADLAEAERRPSAVFPVKWEMGFAALLPHISIIQNAARIHQIRMAAHLAQSDVGAAYEEFRGMLRLYRALEKEPTLIAGLVRVSVLNLAASGVWDGLAQRKWDAATLAKFQNDFGSFNLLADYHFAFGSERAGMNDILDRMRGTQPPSPEIEALAGLGQNWGEQTFLRAYSYLPGLVARNQLAINRFHDTFLPRVDVEGARFYDSGETDAEMSVIRDSLPKRYFYSLYLLAAPSLTSVEKTYLHGHTSLQLTRLACALEQFRATGGAYPERLDALVPRYIDALPHDVIDGEPLRYHRTGDGRFLLYSVAMNARDDGGTAGHGKGRDADDWAWHWPAPEAYQPRK